MYTNKGECYLKAHKRKKRASILEQYRYNIIVSVVIGLFTIVLCMSICSVVVSMVDVSIKMINILNSINIGIGSYIAGYFSAIKRQKSGILSGVICGILISFSIVLLGILLNIDGGLFSKLCKTMISIICGAIGGIKSANSHSI